MNAAHHPTLQRLRHWQGEMLRSRDLNDAASFAAHLRWSHNRAIHNAFGIAHGFAVEVDEAEGSLLVKPGLAYDAFGRELLLLKPERVPFPARELPGRGLLLLVSYRATSDHPNPQELAGACLPACQEGSPERPRFLWNEPDCFDPCLGVPLVRLPYEGAVAAAYNPPVVRPLARPRLAAGATLEGATAWRLWTWPPQPEGEAAAREGGGPMAVRAVSVPREPLPLGLQVSISTAAAGFTSLPCYFAWPAGSLWDAGKAGKQLAASSKEISGAPLTAALSGLVALQLIQARFGHVSQASPHEFVYRLWFPQFAKLSAAFGRRSNHPAQFLLNLARSHLTVGWLGLQMDSERTATDHGNP